MRRDQAIAVTFLRLVSSMTQDALLIVDSGAWIKPFTYNINVINSAYSLVRY